MKRKKRNTMKEVFVKRGVSGQSTYAYIKSTTLCVPSSEMGLSKPLSRQRVWPSPPEPGRGHNCLRVRGWESPNSDDLRKA